jgi:DNA-binding response OmpR family regulator
MRVLILDDDHDFLKSILPDVEKDFVTDVAYSSEDGEYLCSVNDYDSLIVSNKYFTGFQNYTNLLVLTDKDCPSQKIFFLNKGADVVMDRKVCAKELSAQVRALLRRRGNKETRVKNNPKSLILNFQTNELEIDSKKILLRHKEFQILEYLLLNKNKIVSECEILEHVWNDGLSIMSNTVAVHIRSVRKKINQLGGSVAIQTLKNLGYVLKDV